MDATKISREQLRAALKGLAEIGLTRVERLIFILHWGPDGLSGDEIGEVLGIDGLVTGDTLADLRVRVAKIMARLSEPASGVPA